MSIPVAAIFAAAIGALVEGLLLYLLLGMLRETGAVRKNYQGIDVPVSSGVSFPITLMVVYMIYIIASRYDSSYHLFILGLMAISFLGFIDDMLGQRDTLGFKGHFGALFHGRLTTGGLKALGGGIIAFFTALFVSQGWGSVIINTLILALFTNMMNLLDLRPGRAVKGFILFFLVIVLLAGGKVDWLLITPLLGAVLYYFRFDLKAETMMGDAGSNVLGLALGYITVTSLPLFSRLGVLIFLVAIHIYTEKYSLTDTINRVYMLRTIDQLGRRVNND